MKMINKRGKEMNEEEIKGIGKTTEWYLMNILLELKQINILLKDVHYRMFEYKGDEENK